MFRIVAKIDNVTTENDEYSVRYDQNWDVTSPDDDDDSTTTNTNTGSILSTTTHGGYKVGQKKVVQFQHVFTDVRSYDVTLTATILAPNLPVLHLVQHTANYTIAISEVLCFATTGQSHSQTDTDQSNNIFAKDDDVVVPPAPSVTPIDVQNASSTETGEMPSSSSSSRRMLPLSTMPMLVVVSWFLAGWEW